MKRLRIRHYSLPHCLDVPEIMTCADFITISYRMSIPTIIFDTSILVSFR
jgi:hypothetical protein